MSHAQARHAAQPPDRLPALFVLPMKATSPQRPVVAGWLAGAALASAAERRHGAAWLLTQDGIATPSEARARSVPGEPTAQSGPSWRRRLIPTVARTGISDVRAWRRMRTLTEQMLTTDLPTPGVRYVWQRHKLFFGGGRRLADAHGAPLVLSVHALNVREAASHAVSRPVWGAVLDRQVEGRQLCKADLVTCVSDELAEAIGELGVPVSRTRVIPNGVDTALFHPGVDGSAIRKRYGLEDSFVVGWVGTFNWFHGLDVLLAALRHVDLPDQRIRVLLVGSGPEEQRLKERAKQLRVDHMICFAGAKPQTDVPRYIAAMDVAVLACGDTDTYHFSPLKLREYLAMSRPVIAPSIGEMKRQLRNQIDALLVEPAQSQAIADAILCLYRQPRLRHRLGTSAGSRVRKEYSWDRIIDQIDDALYDIMSNSNSPQTNGGAKPA